MQRVSQRCQGFFLRLDTVEDRRFFLERVTQGFQAFLGNVENQIALRAMVLGQPFEVVLDAGDCIGKHIQALPIGNRLARQQLFLNIAIGSI